MGVLSQYKVAENRQLTYYSRCRRDSDGIDDGRYFCVVWPRRRARPFRESTTDSICCGSPAHSDALLTAALEFQLA